MMTSIILTVMIFHTIEECLDWYWNIRDGFEEKRGAEEFRKFSKEEFDKEVHKVASYTVNAIKAKRYKHKKETIQKWVDRDRKEQEKLGYEVRFLLLFRYSLGHY